VPDISKIIAYENGELDAAETLTLFADLIKTGLAWQLQGSVYGRPAANLIEQGLITPQGQITEDGLDWAAQVDIAQAEHDTQVAAERN
jgi:hypothetical protein